MCGIMSHSLLLKVPLQFVLVFYAVAARQLQCPSQMLKFHAHPHSCNILVILPDLPELLSCCTLQTHLDWVSSLRREDMLPPRLVPHVKS